MFYTNSPVNPNNDPALSCIVARVGGTNIGTSVIITWFLRQPNSHGSIFGGSALSACFQVQACKCARLMFSKNASFVGAKEASIGMFLLNLPTFAAHSLCLVIDMSFEVGWP